KADGRSDGDGDDTEARLRDLLEKIKEKKRRESPLPAEVPDAIEPKIKVSESVEVLKPAGEKPQEGKKAPDVERLLGTP
ncbi:MAG: hypothetical protein PHG96_08090, partial [Kiritimatiellae bacterium]|nr:hypothetical protein [Kiritimatiellia bacterium]